jgi:2-succinyl-5-enolpyruvyl-6-hydroxy-3-cyclohexene-1-carboxylate synthase
VIQTAWAELVVATLADAGVTTCVVSPGSRSTPIVAALAGEPRIATPVVIDERAAAFCALGAARAGAGPVALVCTSGTAAAHWLPALIEASAAGVPLVAITADRPPELQRCGAPQTIDQVELFGGFVRAYVDLGPPDGSALALRAVRRKVAQAVSLARGPHPGPVHLEVPLRKPLEPVYDPSTRGAPRAPLARGERDDGLEGRTPDPFAIVRALRAAPLVVAPPPRLVAADAAIASLAAALAAAKRPLLVAGPAALSPADADGALELARRAGLVVLAETGSQLRLRPPRSGVVAVEAFDPILATSADELAPDLVLQLGAEPVAAAWPGARDRWRSAPRWVLTAHDWIDPDSSAAGIVAGELADAATRLAAALPASVERERAAWHAAWRDAAVAARAALDAAVDAAPDGEAAVVRAVLAALPAEGALLVGNSLPIRVVDHVATSAARAARVLTQRGACGIDGLVAGAAGATWTGRPVVAIVGDVSFAHDLGGLAAAVRVATAPLAVVVIDNGGGRIFDGLPVATAIAPPALASFFHTPSGLDPVAVAAALGARAITAATPAAAAAAVAAATASAGVTVIHAPVAADGAHRVRREAIAQLATPQPATLGVRP